jgi:hypothetical protein
VIDSTSGASFPLGTGGREHFDHVQVNDFASLWICVCSDPIRVPASDVTLALIFQNPAMEIVGVPLADYDWVTHVVCGFVPQRHTRRWCQSLGFQGLRISPRELILNSLNSRSLDVVAARVWHRQCARILHIRRRTGYGLVHLIGTGQSCLNSRAAPFTCSISQI